MFTRILVALDGSDHAQHALSVAINIATKYEAHVQLLSVVHPNTFMSSPYPPTSATIQLLEQALMAQRQHQQTILSSAFDEMCQHHPQLECSMAIKDGRPADVIVQTAIDDHVDLIVLGSRGLGGIKQLFLGSVSDRVADEARCPVLIVK